jgi:hypothetical protein
MARPIAVPPILVLILASALGSFGAPPEAAARAAASAEGASARLGAGDSTAAQAPEDVRRWWKHVSILAGDGMRGRQTGSPEHGRAASYVAGEFEKLGLAKGAGSSYIQPVEFVSRKVREPECRVELVFPDRVEPLVLGKDVALGMSSESAAEIELPVAFAGYALSVPEQDYDDPKSVDLKGKLALYLGGGPASVTEPRRSSAMASGERWRALRAAGALGQGNISNPHHSDIPWERGARNRFAPSMSLADSTLDERKGMRLSLFVNPDSAEKWFRGAPHRFAELLAMSDSSLALPRFALVPKVRATVRYDRQVVESQNVVAVLPGRDPRLRGEAVVLSAHLDHLGVGAPAQGDSIYNGAWDNASGVASLIEIARALSAPERRPARSVVFVLVTGEEKGLLGSHYFAHRPTMPIDSIVANLNVDMVLPIVPMDHLVIHGVDESTLGDRARELARERGIEVLPDPEPHRRLFVRSDQFNFIRNGVPALAPMAGAPKGTPEDEKLRAWIRERYHQPGDDLNQAFEPAAVSTLVDYVTELAARVANDPTRPTWKASSFFRRYATAAP